MGCSFDFLLMILVGLANQRSRVRFPLWLGAHILIKLGRGGGNSIVGPTSEFRYTDVDTVDRKTTLQYLHIQTRSMLGPTFYFS